MTTNRYTQYLADPRTVIGDLAATLRNYGLLPTTDTTQRDHDEPLTLADLPTNEHNEEP